MNKRQPTTETNYVHDDFLSSITNMVKHEYRCHPGLPDLLDRLLRVAINVTSSEHGAIRFNKATFMPDAVDESPLIACDKGRWCDPAHHDEDCVVCASFEADSRSGFIIANDLQGSEPRCTGVVQRFGSSMSLPVLYQTAVIGVLTLTSPHLNHYSCVSAEACQILTREIAFHLKRREISTFIKSKLSKDLALVGVSDALKRVDRFIEKASRVDLPVLITGDFGTEKEFVAYALHFIGSRRDRPLIEINCELLPPNAPPAELLGAFERAQGGTLFFNSIDHLDYRLQLHLATLLTSAGKSVAETGNHAVDDVRVLASASVGFDDLLRDKGFSRHLLIELGFLCISLAPLRERVEDIRPLITYFLDKYSGDQHLSITNEVVTICEQHEWSANICEIERAVARLATMAEHTVTTEDVRVYTPALYTSQPASTAQQHAKIDTYAQTMTSRRDPVKHSVAPQLVSLVCKMTESQPVDLRRFHPSLQKALIYLTQNSAEDISLEQLASHVCISSSHLCHLFRKELSTNFKSVLSIIRVEKAKSLLTEMPHLSTSEVSSAVGFGDPRHYQRIFKRHVGCTTREYKRNASDSRFAAATNLLNFK
jgi:DNA-binding NtrC family response regulator